MKPTTRLLLSLYVAFALAGAALTLYCVCLGYYRGPFRDLWIAMDFIRAYFSGTTTFTDFFALHGGAHRLAVPRAFFLVEYGIFGGSNVFLIVCSALIQASAVYAVWQLARGEQAFEKVDRIFLTALALALMINTAQLENFLYTFDMQWFATSAAAIWALICWQSVFTVPAERQRTLIIPWVAALGFTAVSMFSSFSGLCIWLVLPWLAVVYRCNRAMSVTTVIAAVVVVAFYISGPFAEGGDWQSPAHVTTSMAVNAVLMLCLRWLQWTGLYLGSPLSRWNASAGFVFAYGGLSYLLTHAWQLARHGMRDSTRFERTMLSIALWAATVGIATGLGRMYFVHTAPEDRYQSIVLVYWLGLFAHLYSRTRTSKRFAPALVLITFWSMIVVPIAGVQVALAQVTFFDRVANANIAVATGQWNFADIKDTLILGDKWKKTSRPAMHGDFLREHHWGIFAEPDVAQLGQLLNAATIDQTNCDGAIDSTTWTDAPHHGLRITGRGIDNDKRPFGQLVIADDTNHRIGLARLERPKNFLLPRVWQDANASHWLGYTVDLPDVPASVRVLGKYERDGATRYCPVATLALPLADSGP